MFNDSKKVIKIYHSKIFGSFYVIAPNTDYRAPSTIPAQTMQEAHEAAIKLAQELQVKTYLETGVQTFYSINRQVVTVE